MIVMPDADLDQAVDALMGAGFGSAGERCMAIAVAVPVGEKTADRLVEALAPKIRTMKVGPATDKESEMGPVITAEAKQRITDLIGQGVKEGADLVVDGRGLELQGYERGFFLGGSLFDRVTKDMTVYKTEIFGPVLSVVRADGYAEAADLVNSNAYGNGAAIFTRDGDTARAFAASIEIGMVGINVAIPVTVPVRRSRRLRPGRRALLHPPQDRDRPLADRHPRRCRVPFSELEVVSSPALPGSTRDNE
jgi:malonate-semialdehyde dehydrogenase (acetylating)/methylmalonate-semialdehyde dehydrogenase